MAPTVHHSSFIIHHRQPQQKVEGVIVGWGSRENLLVQVEQVKAYCIESWFSLEKTSSSAKYQSCINVRRWSDRDKKSVRHEFQNWRRIKVWMEANASGE
jgi:hypothetical protein